MLSYNVLNSWVEKMMKKSLPVKIKTSNITTLSTKDINKLKAGDIVLKKTGNQKHTYIVGYKENNQGICLTYTDATVIETVSYDYVDGEWVYNSTDIGRVGGVEYTAGTGISITDGVISNTKKEYIYSFEYSTNAGGFAVWTINSDIDVDLTNITKFNQLMDLLFGSLSSGSKEYINATGMLRISSVNYIGLYVLGEGGTNNSWTLYGFNKQAETVVNTVDLVPLSTISVNANNTITKREI